ncbi:MAG: hypothetical protein MR854_08900, partial [Clostridiaceae bacterium]|nr:hypothetical protein [Clostridiaceae bacterium]
MDKFRLPIPLFELSGFVFSPFAGGTNVVVFKQAVVVIVCDCSPINRSPLAVTDKETDSSDENPVLVNVYAFDVLLAMVPT